MRFLILSLLFVSVAAGAEPPRLCVLTDIGGDPDNQQSLVRLMVYSNEFPIEGLVASVSGTPGKPRNLALENVCQAHRPAGIISAA